MTEDDINGTLFILSLLNCSLDIITIQKKVNMGNTKNEYIELQIIQNHFFTFKTKTMMINTLDLLVWRLSFTKLLKQSPKFKPSIALFYERRNL